MYREQMNQLEKWRTSPNRKPLVLRGARQVGKTWLLREFGRTCFSNVAYVRVEDNEPVIRLFEGSLEPERLLRGIAAVTKERINPQTTLVILDEVQAAPRALTALKYFCEDAPEYAVAVAGSLLGVAIHAGVSFPVGKVEFLDLYPLTFREFLLAMGESELEGFVREGDFNMMEVFRERYADLLRTYYFIGGMPEVVDAFAKNRDFAQARRLQTNILEAFRGDFSKHSGAVTGERCRMIFDSLPRHLAKENKKFVYGVVKKGARGRDLDDALQFLLDAGLVMKVPRVSRAGLPMGAYADESAFKLFCLDIGLLGALANVDSRTILEGNTLFTQFKGALAEQYACQQLVGDCGLAPYYWTAEKSSAEVDFTVQVGGEFVPVEVKAEENLRAKSLAAFCKTYGLKNAVRLSLSNYREESWMTNIPLYATYCLPRVCAKRLGS